MSEAAFAVVADAVEDAVGVAGIETGPGGNVFSAPLVDEPQLPVGITNEVPALGVNEAVVEAAQGDKVIQIGGPVVGPMNDVMGMGPAGAATSGKPASPIAGHYQAS